MNITKVLTEKKENSVMLKKTLGLLLKYKPLGLVKLSDKVLTKDLVEGLKSLPTGFVVYSQNEKTELVSNNVVITGTLDNSLLSGFDFVVCDDNIDSLGVFLEKGITPIIIKDNHLSAILKEFNPLKNDGNAYFYEQLNKWDIYYTIVRYMENYKFPYDNKNLVNNILNG